MNQKLKLYVWEKFSPDYSDGLAFAIAENLEEAQEMIMSQMKFRIVDFGPVNSYPIDEKICKYCLGGM